MVRQLYKRVYGDTNHVVIGTLKDSADVMEDWYRGEACDGFLLDGPYLPGGFFNICDMVVPELQRRGLFRTDSKGNTLRERMGLPTSPNQFRSEELRGGKACVSTYRARWWPHH